MSVPGKIWNFNSEEVISDPPLAPDFQVLSSNSDAPRGIYLRTESVFDDTPVPGEPFLSFNSWNVTKPGRPLELRANEKPGTTYNLSLRGIVSDPPGQVTFESGPFAIQGYYPLYTTENLANSAGDGSSHTHEFDGITYYMPNGVDFWHGDYDDDSTGGILLNETPEPPLGIYLTAEVVALPKARNLYLTEIIPDLPGRVSTFEAFDAASCDIPSDFIVDTTGLNKTIYEGQTLGTDYLEVYHKETGLETPFQVYDIATIQGDKNWKKEEGYKQLLIRLRASAAPGKVSLVVTSIDEDIASESPVISVLSIVRDVPGEPMLSTGVPFLNLPAVIETIPGQVTELSAEEGVQLPRSCDIALLGMTSDPPRGTFIDVDSTRSDVPDAPTLNDFTSDAWVPDIEYFEATGSILSGGDDSELSSGGRGYYMPVERRTGYYLGGVFYPLEKATTRADYNAGVRTMDTEIQGYSAYVKLREPNNSSPANPVTYIWRSVRVSDDGEAGAAQGDFSGTLENPTAIVLSWYWGNKLGEYKGNLDLKLSEAIATDSHRTQQFNFSPNGGETDIETASSNTNFLGVEVQTNNIPFSVPEPPQNAASENIFSDADEGREGISLSVLGITRDNVGETTELYADVFKSDAPNAPTISVDQILPSPPNKIILNKEGIISDIPGQVSLSSAMKTEEFTLSVDSIVSDIPDKHYFIRCDSISDIAHSVTLDLDSVLSDPPSEVVLSSLIPDEKPSFIVLRATVVSSDASGAPEMQVQSVVSDIVFSPTLSVDLITIPPGEPENLSATVRDD
tara:strand:+ start:6855 stop:9236 length:2382 start_codon:yes stop_codon:yes gene_type:complete